MVNHITSQTWTVIHQYQQAPCFWRSLKVAYVAPAHISQACQPSKQSKQMLAPHGFKWCTPCIHVLTPSCSASRLWHGAYCFA